MYYLLRNFLDKGLLPSPENVKELKTALEGAKKRWIDVRIDAVSAMFPHAHNGNTSANSLTP